MAQDCHNPPHAWGSSSSPIDPSSAVPREPSHPIAVSVLAPGGSVVEAVLSLGSSTVADGPALGSETSAEAPPLLIQWPNPSLVPLLRLQSVLGFHGRSN